jgi:hypothetical protein
MLLNGAAQIEETATQLRLPVSLVCPRPYVRESAQGRMSESRATLLCCGPVLTGEAGTRRQRPTLTEIIVS